jgi:predicted lipoprotein with Yx(FWY)xxD motif
MKSKSVLLSLLLLGATVAQANPTVESNGVLANKEGKTLYVFTKDTPNKSNCNGGCATAWPPFMVANPALAGGDFSIVTRDDGGKQWAFKGQPLYFFAGDAKAGDMTGEGQGGVWFVVKTKAADKPVKTSRYQDNTPSSSYTY